MATQASGVAGADASGISKRFLRLIERFGLLQGGIIALAGSAAALWKDPQPELRWAVIGLACAALLFLIVGRS